MLDLAVGYIGERSRAGAVQQTPSIRLRLSEETKADKHPLSQGRKYKPKSPSMAYSTALKADKGHWLT
jgi:hypothetical protein